MNAQELFVKSESGDYKPSTVYFCSNCRIVSREWLTAEQCCKMNTCTGCGKECDKKHWTKCDSCLNKDEEKRELERFNKATKIDIKDYKGFLLSDETVSDDFASYFYNYFENHDLSCPNCEGKTEEKDCPDIKGYSHLKCSECGWVSECVKNIEEIFYLFSPKYIWATRFEPLSLDYGSIMENVLDDHHETVQDCIKGEEDFKKAIDKFNELNKDNGTYWESNKVALINIKEYVRELYE